MIEALNRFANAYGGLIGLLGTVLGVIGIAYGVYSRNNPRRPKHRVAFKPFGYGEDISDLVGYAMRRRRRPQEFTSYVDIWNDGSETVTSNVIREPLSVALQSRERQKLLAAEIVRESHPGVSQFSVHMDGNIARLSWVHFDPGMCARISIRTKLPPVGEEIEVFGTGFRLELRRIRAIDDGSTLPGRILRWLLWGALPLAIFCTTTGTFLEWTAHEQFSSTIWKLVALPVSLGVLLIGFVSAGTGAGLLVLVGRLLNLRSPLERQLGLPAVAHEVDGVLAEERHRLSALRLEAIENDRKLQLLRAASEEHSPGTAPKKPRVRPQKHSASN